jgi:cell division protein FtsQ
VHSPSLREPDFRDTANDLWSRAFRVLGAGLAGGVFVTVVGLLGHQVASGEHWEVDVVQVAGNLHASETAIRHLADIAPGSHLLSIDLLEVATSVEKHPWVARVEVRRMLPSTVEVVVEEHQPAMLLALDRLWLVSTSGKPFKQARGEVLDLPVLTGIDPVIANTRPDLASGIVQGALRVLEAADGHPQVGPTTISELRFSDKLGFSLVTRTGSELILGFGTPADALDRLDRLMAAGLDMSIPQRIDLDAGSVAIATPLPDPRSLTSRP